MKSLSRAETTEGDQFLKTLPSHGKYAWTAQQYINHQKKQLGGTDLTDEVKVLKITYDEDGEPFMPPGPYDRQTEILRKVLSQYMRIYLGNTKYTLYLYLLLNGSIHSQRHELTLRGGETQLQCHDWSHQGLH